MRIIVQKFGGTSVATQAAREQAIARVLEAWRAGLSPVVVVSAMGRCGDPYATDTLLALADTAPCTATPRERDLIAHCGEVITAVVMAGALRAAGLDAVALTGAQAGIITDQAFTAAEIRRIDTTSLRQQLLVGRVPVVAGFQGRSETGEITTLGRGGSDTTAAAIAAALEAEVAEIYTDVDGIMTADPRLVPAARSVPTLDYQTALRVSAAGAKVIHPRAVSIAMESGVPMRVRSTFGAGPGTLITQSAETPSVFAAAIACHAAGPGQYRVTIIGLGILAADELRAQAARALAEAGVMPLQPPAGNAVAAGAGTQTAATCLVAEADLDRALRCLHDTLAIAGQAGARTGLPPEVSAHHG